MKENKGKNPQSETEIPKRGSYNRGKCTKTTQKTLLTPYYSEPTFCGREHSLQSMAPTTYDISHFTCQIKSNICRVNGAHRWGKTQKQQKNFLP